MSAAAELAALCLAAFILAPLSPPPCARRRTGRSLPLSLLVFLTGSLGGLGSVSAVGAPEKPLLLLPLPPRRGPKLSFSRMAFLELVSHSSLGDVILANKVKRVNRGVCKELEAGVVK